MIKLNITRLEKRMSIKPQTENDLSSILVAKNTPVRNYSLCIRPFFKQLIATRNSKASTTKPPMPILEQQFEASTRTFSAQSQQQSHQEPLIEKKLSENNVAKPHLLPRPIMRHQRKLVHIQTSPNELTLDRKSLTESQNIIYDEIGLTQHTGDIEILFKGFRNISCMNRVTVISYNLLFGDWNSQFFGKHNDGNKTTILRQLVMRLKSESILVLLLNRKQRLNSLVNNQIEMFDCIISAINIESKETLSFKKNYNNIWLKLDRLNEYLKINGKIKDYLLIDQLYIENDNYKPDQFQNKILMIQNCKLVHLYLNPLKANLSKLYSSINLHFRQNVLLKEIQRLDLKNMIEECNININEIQQQDKFLEHTEEMKNKLKLYHHRNQQQTALQIIPEQRAEKFRDQMIGYIKSKSQQKINNMHFIVGDTIMRNIQFFRQHNQDRFHRDIRHKETIQIIEHMHKKQLPPMQNLESQSNYAFYYLN